MGKDAHCPERTRDATQPAMIVALGLVTKKKYTELLWTVHDCLLCGMVTNNEEG